MDLLAQRYASPFLVLDQFARLHQLHDFTIEILETMAKEKAHDMRWQYYLHRVWDMSFDEYVRKCEETNDKNAEMTYEEIGSVIEESKRMLEGFVPE